MVINLEEFSCAIYRKSRNKSVHDIRYSILKQKCINLERNINLSNFPPCRKTLSQHIRQVNQPGIWKVAHIPQPYIPPAIEGHVWTENKGEPEPIWCQGPIIPIDIAEEDDTLESDDDVARSSEEEVLSDDSAVAENDSYED